MYFSSVFLGLPLALVVFLVVARLIMDIPGLDSFSGIPLGFCAALCVWYVCSGIDKLIYAKKDNPEAFDTPIDYPQTFGIIKQAIAGRNLGPFAWTIRSTEETEGRIVALLNFTEPLLHVAAMTQAPRIVMLEVTVTPLTQEQMRAQLSRRMTLGLSNELPMDQTKVKLTWTVHAPVSRERCDREIESLTYSIKHALRVEVKEPPKPRHALIPPYGLLGTTAFALLFTLGTAFENCQKHVNVRKVQQQDHAVEISQQLQDQMRQQRQQYIQEQELHQSQMDEFLRNSNREASPPDTLTLHTSPLLQDGTGQSVRNPFDRLR
ncbi:MAG: hypothetical protein K2W95_14215 [Candidatus Obscuribacterales bacterium]|nr:hypothetical protein [Candidatus Obscuribacterales bacterium]